MVLKLATIICLLVMCLYACDAKSDKVKLEKVQVLTLQADKWTTGRRSSPIKQLACVGGYCSRAKVTSAQCYNRGFDGRDVQWECKAEMPANYKFGKVEVLCEGYSYPEDDYILVGSCGLEYTIDEVGGGGGYQSGHNPSYSQQYHSANNYIQKSDFSYWPIIIIVGLIAFIYFTCLREPQGQRSNAYSNTSDDYPNSGPRPSAPPPPPGFRSEYFDSGSDSCRGSQQQSRSSSSSGPGFYSGMATGGFLGYLFGSSRSNTYANRPTTSSWGYGPSTSHYSGSSGYSGASTSGGSSSETRTSSGFGSTRRR